MKLQDYINYYIGAPCIFYMADDDPDGYNTTLDYDTIKKWLADQDETDIKLILRRLEDMTKEQAGYIIDTYSFRSVDMPMNEVKFAIEIAKRLREQMSVAHYLLQQHFDLFGLIDAGLAIDIKTSIT